VLLQVANRALVSDKARTRCLPRSARDSREEREMGPGGSVQEGRQLPCGSRTDQDGLRDEGWLPILGSVPSQTKMHPGVF
jgi:hypothetical protein